MVGKQLLKTVTHIIPDELYLRLKYRVRTGKPLNLKNPSGFNEKLQWLKIHDRNPGYAMLVDKYEVKRFVSDRIGEDYIIPTLGVWERFEDIDFGMLPDQFVLKCTHDSGGLVICKDKSCFDEEEARRKINKSLKTNYYWHSREWAYKNVKPRILAEQYMVDTWAQRQFSQNAKTDGLIDYKFFCFHGVPKFLYVAYANLVDGKKDDLLSYIDFNWNLTPFYRVDHKQIPVLPPKPDNLEEMIMIAEKLSANIPFVRVDLYCIDGKIYFSELTFCPGGGFGLFSPEEWEKRIGDLIKIHT